MQEAITIDELWALCVAERKKGNGKKKILISSDDEGNSYHQLFFGFTPTTEEGSVITYFDQAYIPCPPDINPDEVKDYIILG